MPSMHRYVVGLAFTKDHQQVLLLRKRRPEWQAGLLNGVGGKVEEGEDFPPAMTREFKEETGLEVPPESWRHAITFVGTDYELRFFTTISADIRTARTTTDEPLFVVRTEGLPKLDVIPNLRWVIPLCLDPVVQVPMTVQVSK